MKRKYSHMTTITKYYVAFGNGNKHTEFIRVAYFIYLFWMKHKIGILHNVCTIL
jgi:hypothetical protein